MKKKVYSGFTLVELLISITIISILTVLGFSAYAYFQKSARDAKRQSDLKFIQSALEQYHADQKYYPFSLASPFTNATGAPADSSRVLKTYLTTTPADPKDKSVYSYVASPANCDNSPPKYCISYCLYTKMEGTANLISDTNCAPTLPYTLGITRP